MPDDKVYIITKRGIFIVILIDLALTISVMAMGVFFVWVLFIKAVS